MKAIKTTWNGTTYRSRLEARWAIYFQQVAKEFCGDIHYEPAPLRCKGRKDYIPDFCLTHNDGRAWIFEVKPKWISDEYRTDLQYAALVANVELETELILLVGDFFKGNLPWMSWFPFVNASCAINQWAFTQEYDTELWLDMAEEGRFDLA